MKMTAILGENEIISTREFDFPRERVFEAWINPELREQINLPSVVPGCKGV
jgi:Uncharacterized conserved protein